MIRRRGNPLQVVIADATVRAHRSPGPLNIEWKRMTSVASDSTPTMTIKNVPMKPPVASGYFALMIEPVNHLRL